MWCLALFHINTVFIRMNFAVSFARFTICAFSRNTMAFSQDGFFSGLVSSLYFINNRQSPVPILKVFPISRMQGMQPCSTILNPLEVCLARPVPTRTQVRSLHSWNQETANENSNHTSRLWLILWCLFVFFKRMTSDFPHMHWLWWRTFESAYFVLNRETSPRSEHLVAWTRSTLVNKPTRSLYTWEALWSDWTIQTNTFQCCQIKNRKWGRTLVRDSAEFPTIDTSRLNGLNNSRMEKLRCV